MNKPIRTISLFCLLLFVALMLNATYLQFGQASELDNNPRNRRVIEAAYSVERGAILVGRTPIADSVEVDDQYEFQRTYDQPFKYAPITGFFSFFSQTGIERAQNEVLSGEDDRLFVTKLVDLLSNKAQKGGSVQLTLDPDAQDAAYDGLLNTIGPEGEGSVVALDPRTGKILAMVSLPSYDPNLLASHDFSAVNSDFERLNSADGEPLLNRAIQKTLPPGSTFKLVTAAAAIESGQYDADSQVPGGATYQLPQTTGDTGLVDNEGRSACNPEMISFSTAMENSCNTTFARLAVDLGSEKMLAAAEAFGFNADYLEDLGPQAKSVFPEGSNAPETGQTGIGQFEVRATPLQMAMVAAGIANEGVVKRPYIVDEVQSASFEPLDKTSDEDFRPAISSATASDLTKLLVATVEQGTASAAAIPGVSVAGKTGTAQSGGDGPPYAWFVSFAPAEDPEVAVAVMIESAPNVPRESIAGGALGGPIAKAVMEAVIR
ncbi:penicillin-binding protein 2 [Nocardioides salsibiostraticola]